MCEADEKFQSIPRKLRPQCHANTDPNHVCSPNHVRVPAHCRLKKNKKKKVVLAITQDGTEVLTKRPRGRPKKATVDDI